MYYFVMKRSTLQSHKTPRNTCCSWLLNSSPLLFSLLFSFLQLNKDIIFKSLKPAYIEVSRHEPCWRGWGHHMDHYIPPRINGQVIPKTPEGSRDQRLELNEVPHRRRKQALHAQMGCRLQISQKYREIHTQVQRMKISTTRKKKQMKISTVKDD